jgi:hypothetical protein
MQKPWRAASLETRVGVTITMSSILGCIDDHNVQVKMKGDLLEAVSCMSKRSQANTPPLHIPRRT